MSLQCRKHVEQDACSGVHTGLKMATFEVGVMCSREVNRDTAGLDHINITNKYNHDQQLSTITTTPPATGNST
jgi:hypothetical protein